MPKSQFPISSPSFTENMAPDTKNSAASSIATATLPTVAIKKTRNPFQISTLKRLNFAKKDRIIVFPFKPQAEAFLARPLKQIFAGMYMALTIRNKLLNFYQSLDLFHRVIFQCIACNSYLESSCSMRTPHISIIIYIIRFQEGNILN